MNEHLYPILQSVLVYVKARVVVRVGYPLLLAPCADVEERSRQRLLVGGEVLPGHKRAHHLDGRFSEKLPHGLLGTLLGQTWVNQWVEVAFLAIAGGSILYVVVELFAVCRRFEKKALVTWWVLGGLFLGFATELVLEAAGA